MTYVIRIKQVLTLEKEIDVIDSNVALDVGENILNNNEVPYSQYELEAAEIEVKEKIERGKLISFPQGKLNI